MPRFDNLSAEELEQIRRFIEESDIDVIDDEMRELVEKHLALTCRQAAAARDRAVAVFPCVEKRAPPAGMCHGGPRGINSWRGK